MIKISLTAFCIILIIQYIGFQIGLWAVFSKAGLKGWQSIIPIYRLWIWLRRVIDRSWWWMILLFLPFINVFMVYMMIWKTIRLFRKTSYWILIPGTLFYFIYLPYLGFSKKETFTAYKDMPVFKKSSAREWGDAIIFAVAAAYIFRTFLFELYAIPTSSMESSLMVGDYLAVSKFHYGGRIPQTVFAIPFMHNTLVFTQKVPSFVDWIELPYYRFPAVKKIKNNDPVVFNYPDGDTVVIERQSESYYAIVREFEAMLNPNASPADKEMLVHRYRPEEVIAIRTRYGNRPYYPGLGRKIVSEIYTVRARPIDKRENYVKRCVGLPGDKLTIINGQLSINDRVVENPKNMQMMYDCDVILSKKVIKDLNINREDGSMSQGIYCLNLTQKNAIEKMGHTLTCRIDKPGYDAAIFPHDPHYPWNKDNFGPLVIPKQGVTVEINNSTIALYDKIIRNYELNTLEQKDGKIYINGKIATSYTFKQNYYFMMGDNRHNSADSRYWGFVPEDHIVGKPVLVWLSLNKFRNWFDGKIRWEKMFKTIH